MVNCWYVEIFLIGANDILRTWKPPRDIKTAKEAKLRNEQRRKKKEYADKNNAEMRVCQGFFEKNTTPAGGGDFFQKTPQGLDLDKPSFWHYLCILLFFSGEYYRGRLLLVETACCAVGQGQAFWNFVIIRLLSERLLLLEKRKMRVWAFCVAERSVA